MGCALESPIDWVVELGGAPPFSAGGTDSFPAEWRSTIHIQLRLHLAQKAHIYLLSHPFHEYYYYYHLHINITITILANMSTFSVRLLPPYQSREPTKY